MRIAGGTIRFIKAAACHALLACGVLCLTTGCETVEGIKRDISGIDVGPSGPTGPLATFSEEPDIRVRVVSGTKGVTISGPGYVIIRPVRGLKGERLATPVTLAGSREGIRVTGAGAAARTLAFGTDAEILSSDQSGAASATGSIRVNQVTYPGIVIVRARWNDDPTTLDVVAQMGVETYLPGVLTHELFKDWHRQAYEAQAIAARTYALHERARARGENKAWDVESSTADQVYGGSTTSVVALEATRATRGRLLTDRGRLIRAYYSSTCGGRPSSAAAVWPTDAGYEFNLSPVLQGKPRGHYCQKATLYRWDVTRADDDLSKRIRAWGKMAKSEVETLTRLRKVEVRERNSADRPIRYTLTDDRARTYVLTAEEFRNACNHPAPGVPPITRENRINSGDLEVEVWADRVRIRGRGWGHGVGMCQWCAQGMADSGQDWSTMLRDFYPGATVVKAY
ncbi:MAG: SpoIID/LytB domain-containing protein [Phycisphaerales bacterium]|nr:SpoIID/LytB domain-containing protein [Phycisphaerales bacterium]